MRADELAKRYGMEAHVEGGSFLELDEPVPAELGRAASGVIYYHLGPDEYSDFHVLDSDEYWLWHAGAPLEIWMIQPDGNLHIEKLGTGEGCNPCLLLKAGVIFGARHLPGAQDGCFVSCVTVPRFSYEFYRILPREEIARDYPAAMPFFDMKQ